MNTMLYRRQGYTLRDFLQKLVLQPELEKLDLSEPINQTQLPDIEIQPPEAELT